jgi:hypothetical protein
MSESATISPTDAPSNQSDIQTLTVRTQDLTASADRWNGAYMIGVGVTVVFAAIVFVVQFRAVRKFRELSASQTALAEAKDKQLQLDLKAKDEAIGVAQKAAADANSVAEGERLARVKIEERLAWRTISPAQEAKFRAAVPGPPPPAFKVTMTTLAGDAEGAQYADEISKLLGKVGVYVGSTIDTCINALQLSR